MSGQKPRAASALAAALLALLTISVFYVLQDYGPESAIRRFHQGIADNDAFAVQQVLSEPINDPKAQTLEFSVKRLEDAHAEYQIVGLAAETNRVAAELLYVLPNGDQIRT